MDYRAVANRCAVSLSSLHLPISREEALIILSQKGFSLVEVDIVTLARQCIGISKYRRGARLVEAPAIVDCSSFIKWLYAQRGIWLPRRSIQQYEFGETIGINDIIAGDVVFVSGWINYYRDDPACGVGHVGIASGDGTIVHATSCNRMPGVMETSLDKFIGKTKFRGVRRYIPKDEEVFTFETPSHREIEAADDVKWVVLQSLSK